VAAAASPLHRSCHRCVSRSTVPAATVPLGLASTSRSSCAQQRRCQRPSSTRCNQPQGFTRLRLRTTLLARSASCCVSSSCTPAAAVSDSGPTAEASRARRPARYPCSTANALPREPGEAHHDAGHIRPEHVGVDVQAAEAFCEPGVPGFAHRHAAARCSRRGLRSADGRVPKPRATRQVWRAASRHATRRGKASAFHSTSSSSSARAASASSACASRSRWNASLR